MVIKILLQKLQTYFQINLPELVSFISDYFKYFRFPVFIVLKAFVLYMKRNMSYRTVADSLNIEVSYVSIYKWVTKL
ncbi:hypothetical protein [Fervidobacterium sp.]